VQADTRDGDRLLNRGFESQRDACLDRLFITASVLWLE
jgi:hypothetical protein